MATGLLSHFHSGSGWVIWKNRDELRGSHEFVGELPPEATVCYCDAPGGQLTPLRLGAGQEKVEAVTGLMACYLWLAGGPGRVLIVYDWHMLGNTSGHWRSLIRMVPAFKSPKSKLSGLNPVNDAAEIEAIIASDPVQQFASLVVFVVPAFEMKPENPLLGKIPILSYAPPDRPTVRATMERLCPLNGDAEACVDSLMGLSADMVEQAAAENLARTGGLYNPEILLESKRSELRQAGLEVWSPVDWSKIGGLGGLKTVCRDEVFPFLYDKQLAIRRILCAGMPGMGKSYFARGLGGELKRVVCNWSPGKTKGKHVGDTEGAAKNIFETVDAMAPSILVIDEIDCALSRESGDPTSGPVMQILLSWLQESTSDTIVIGTLNRLDKLDAALESRFSLRFFFDLGTEKEREDVAAIHYRRLGCENVAAVASATAELTDGFSSREIAEMVCPSVARQSQRRPTADAIRSVCASVTPASKTQADQLKAMRQAAQTLRRANDPETVAASVGTRRIAKGGDILAPKRQPPFPPPASPEAVAELDRAELERRANDPQCKIFDEAVRNDQKAILDRIAKDNAKGGGA